MLNEADPRISYYCSIQTTNPLEMRKCMIEANVFYTEIQTAPALIKVKKIKNTTNCIYNKIPKWNSHINHIWSHVSQIRLLNCNSLGEVLLVMGVLDI